MTQVETENERGEKNRKFFRRENLKTLKLYTYFRKFLAYLYYIIFRGSVQFMSKNRKRPKPLMFTTVELLTVMAILAILMAMGLGVYSLASTKMAESRTQALIQQICNALELYKAKHGFYIQQQFSRPGFYLDVPTNTYPEDDFTDFLANYEQIKNNDSEEVTTNVYALVDGYGNQLIYYCPGKVNTETFDLISSGSDPSVTGGYITNYK